MAKVQDNQPAAVKALRTRAEQLYLDRFTDVEGQLPGNDAVRRLRRAAIERFAASGLPHRRIEDWKYTDLRAALKEVPAVEAAIVDGNAAAGEPLASVLADPPAWVAEALELQAKGADGVAALNAALMHAGRVLDIPAGATGSFAIGGAITGTVAHMASTVVARSIVRVGANARVSLVEDLRGERPADLNQLTQIDIGDGAEVFHLVQTRAPEGRVHLARWNVRLAANATYRPLHFATGDGIARNELRLDFDGERGHFDFIGGNLGRASSHNDTTLVVDHKVPHCVSRELYKTVLAGEARAVFQGKVIVRPGAQKTDGKQMAKALMLSPVAEFDSKPELEIYADDVVCGHGSASAELDDDHLFYLRSRGIPEAEARAMLTQAFVAELFDRIDDVTLADALRAIATEWLATV